MRSRVAAAVFFLCYFAAMNWPVLAWIERRSVPPEVIWIGPFPLQYFWVLVWSLGAFLALVLLGLTVARDVGARAAGLERTRGEVDR